jgi:hypothetical protein
MDLVAERRSPLLAPVPAHAPSNRGVPGFDDVQVGAQLPRRKKARAPRR